MMYKYFKFKANTTIFLVIVINAVFKIGSQLASVWPFTSYTVNDDLQFLTFFLHLPGAEMTGMCPHV